MVDNSRYMLDLFVEEAREHIQSLNENLLCLEKEGYDPETVHEAYRTMHTLKGTAALLGLDPISEIAHAAEDVLCKYMDTKTAPEREVLNIVFEASDAVSEMITELSEAGEIRTTGADIAGKMRALSLPIEGKKTTNVVDAIKGLALSQGQKDSVLEAMSEGNGIFVLSTSLQKKLVFKEGRMFQLLRKLSPFGRVIATLPDTNGMDDNINEVTILLSSKMSYEGLEREVRTEAGQTTGIESLTITDLEHSNIRYAHPEKPKPEETVKAVQSQAGKSDTVRVKSRLLDELLDLVGEIMISTIRVNQITKETKNKELHHALKNNSRLLSEIQDTVLRMRMVPVDYIFKRFPKMVRDISKENGKDIEFCIVGNDIEIDRSLLDNIGDSLVHLLRNAVDHGIESSERRRIGGKPHKGSIKLTASNEQSNVVITLEDDGGGMDTSKIVAKAVAIGVISADDAKLLDDKQSLNLAFYPGVTTSEVVSEISGRGVGLDIVKNKIESLGGTIRCESWKDKGTRFVIKLPPSMSIIKAMLIEINDEKYAIPLENVFETTKIGKAEVHDFMNSGMFRLRDEVLPIINLHEEFGGRMDDLKKEMPVIIVEKDENRMGLIISGFIGQQEIVVKNLGREVKNAQYFSGATILGDGRVALILDVGVFM